MGLGLSVTREEGPGLKGGGPKISRFLPLPPQNSFLSSSLGVFSWNFGGVEAPKRSSVHVWSSW